MEPPLRIVFCGEVIEGFDAEEVRLSARSRLNASVSQIEQLFSGQPAILKKGLDAKSGARYLALLAHIGMRARLEPERREFEPPAPPPPEPFDPERTQLADVASFNRHIEALQRARPTAPVEASVPRAQAPEASLPPPPPPVAPAPSASTEEPEVRAPAAVVDTPAPAVAAPASPWPSQRPRPEEMGPTTEPQTVFFTEETPEKPATPRKANHSRWPERLFQALLIGGIGYTLYWALTRY